MPGVLVIGTVEAGRLTAESFEAAVVGVRVAGEMSADVTGGLFGSGIADASKQFATTGFASLSAIDDDRLAQYSGDVALAAALKLVRVSGADTIFIPADADSIEWGARLAARLQASFAANCTQVSANPYALLCSRPISGGALQAQFRMAGPMRVVLLAPGQPPAEARAPACEIVSVPLPLVDTRIELIEFVADDLSSGPQLKNAPIVVSGGMGVGSAENWALVEEAASVLDAAVGATRAAVEVGWAPPASQVGFSGLKVAPNLYVAVGISGALHHLAGISRAKKIVAVNNDADANIFKASHLGVVGDVREVIPAFIERVRELRG